MNTKTKMILLIAAILVVILALASPELLRMWRAEESISIGGKDFTEQSVVGEILAQLIEEKTDLRVERNLYLGGTMVCFNALRGGDLDMYVEYTGTGLVNILEKEALADSEEVLRIVRDEFSSRYDLEWLEPLGFNNTYTLTVRRDLAEELELETISDLREKLNHDIVAGFNAEFLERPDGYPGLKEAYDMEFPESPRQMDTGLMYRACAQGDVDVICAFSTDGRIEAYDLVVLEDDKNYFPPYYAAPLARKETLDRHPELREMLAMLAGALDDAAMRELNYLVDREDDPLSPGAAARGFLVEKGLIASE